MRRPLLTLLALTLILLPGLAAPVGAQPGGTVLVSGLNNPRGLSYGEDGTLYIAEAGTGGSQTAVGPFGNRVAVGGTGQITAVAPDGRVTVLVHGLPSMDSGDILGTQAVAVVGDRLWIVQGEGPVSLPFAQSLIGLDLATRRVVVFVDLYTPEAAQNPDGDIIASQPTDLAFSPDGAIYVANAGCNCVMRWSAGEGVSIALSWDIEDNPVPTSVALGPDGDLYVGFLTGFPFPEEGSRIERWRGGELVRTYAGLTAVVGLLVDDEGTIYAVEHGRFGDVGWDAGTGRVVRVDENGLTPLLEGLDRPYGIAKAPDGRLAVTVHAAGEPGTGQVIGFDAGM